MTQTTDERRWDGGDASRIAELEQRLTDLRNLAVKDHKTIGVFRTALVEIHHIAAREWQADETNYEWYGDIAGIVETLGIVALDA
jgi:hypothetical protein